MKPLRVGIVGYGWAASAHIEAINQTTNAQVTAICSSRSLDEEATSREYGAPIRTYTQLDDMLASDLDIISITSHPWKHKDHAVAGAQAGKHLIIEKPLSLTWDDCRSIESAVQKAGVKTCVCFEVRFSSQFTATKALIDQGHLGELHYGEIDYFHGIGPWYGQFPWNAKRSGGGSSLLSAGCHALDALLWCMGDDVESVQSLSTRSRSDIFAPYEYDTTSVTIVKFKSGKIGKTTSSIDCIQPYYFHTHLIGSKGSLLDDQVHLHGIPGMNKNRWSKLSFGLVDSGDVADHPYQNQFQVFFNAIERDEEMPLTNLRNALRTHQVIFAADQSAETGQPVVVPAAVVP